MSGAASLVLVATPLGNLGDLSPRARQALLEADLLLCEDTRSVVRLLGADALLPPRMSCFVGNEHERAQLMLEHLGAGKTVAFVSEAGMPVWSDPGRLLVKAAVEAGFEVDVVPGPTAATTALALSGFVAEGACFVGFIPRSGASRQAALQDLAESTGPSIVYEAGNRVPRLLSDLRGSCADADTRQVVVARELTKLHQEILRGSIAELAQELTEALRGEVTVVVQGGAATADENPGQTAARRAVDILLDPDLKPRKRAKALADLTGWDARDLYERLTKARE